jgi:predicted TPR repeat methyltransferase
MPLYDSFLEHMEQLPPFVKRMEESRQYRVLNWVAAMCPPDCSMSVLEVGVGTGLFARSCRKRDWSYTGVDRNPMLVRRLSEEFNVVLGECPPLPDLGTVQFDIAYAAFVLEHLQNGEAALAFTEALKNKVRSGGVVVLIVPDALTLGLEFWNLDYTHRFPTSWRNVTHIMRETGMRDVQVIKYCGAGWRSWLRRIVRVASVFYYYPFWRWLLRGSELPYSVYQYIKQDMLCFIARVP